MKKISVVEGYKLFFAFLESCYHEYELEDRKDDSLLADLLSDMDILADGIPSDPAAWSDWLDSISKANPALKLELIDVADLNVVELLQPMSIFLKKYHINTGQSSKLINFLIKELQFLVSGQETNSFIKELWLKLTVLNF